MTDFVMPSLGADMERGTVIRWLVKPGDRVKRGDIVAEIETEKADMEVEIFLDGVISDLVAAEGDSVEVGGLLARVEQEAGSPPHEAPVETPPAAAGRQRAPAEPGPEAGSQKAEGGRSTTRPSLRATPTARVLAEQTGVSLDRVAGTGVGGLVTRRDVERIGRTPAATPKPPGEDRAAASPYARKLAAELGVDIGAVIAAGAREPVTADAVRAFATTKPPVSPGRAQAPAPAPPVLTPPAEPGPDEPSRAFARQKAIAGLMERSKREIPHYYLGTSIDLQPALDWLRDENARRPVTDRLVLAALLVRAVARTVADVPEVNGHYVDGSFVPSGIAHVGVAIALRDGSLVTPALLDAASGSLTDLMSAFRDLVSRARTGKLRASEMSSATITVTNLGDLGVEYVHGVIYPPQVAIVGFGKPVERPWADHGMIGVRTMVAATLAGDHRVSNGHRGAVFLNALARRLAKPEEL